MGTKIPQYPPNIKTLPDGTLNPLYNPEKNKPPPPPPPPKKV
jgi:hypothetical protein